MPASIDATLNAHRYLMTSTGVQTVDVHARFRYRGYDPWAVVLAFGNRDRWIRWCVSRELLANGLMFGDGQGDIRIVPDSPTPNRTWITFSSPSGTADLSFDTDERLHVLDLSENVVPWNTESEHIDMDAEIHVLLESF